MTQKLKWLSIFMLITPIAKAEIWICTSSAGTYTLYLSDIYSKSDDGQRIQFFIDTEKGFKDPLGIFSDPNERDIYRGECIVHDEFWVKCQDNDQNNLAIPVTQTLILATGRKNFSFVSQHTYTVVTHAGNCEKV